MELKTETKAQNSQPYASRATAIRRASSSTYCARAAAFLLYIAIFSAHLVMYATGATPTPKDTWSRLSTLPPGTQIHISGDQMSKTCNLISADDEKLICAGQKPPFPHFTFPRENVKSADLTRHGLSSLSEAASGTGSVAVEGRVANSHACSASLNPSGTVVGTAIGAPTASFRGRAIYRRPEAPSRFPKAALIGSPGNAKVR
jgi:hypothetical protein